MTAPVSINFSVRSRLTAFIKINKHIGFWSRYTIRYKFSWQSQNDTWNYSKRYISIAFEKLSITCNARDHCITPATIFSLFKSKILAVIDKIREKKKHFDIDAIYEHITKSQVSNVDWNNYSWTYKTKCKC